MDKNVSKSMSMIEIVNLRGAIDKLMETESESIAVNSVCKSYLKRLDEGSHVEEICEEFVVELSKVAESERAKEILNELNESIHKNENNITLAKRVYALANGGTMFVAPVMEAAIVNYMLNKNIETRNDAKTALALFEGNATVQSIMETLNYEAYQEKAGVNLVNATLKEEFIEDKPKTYTEAEVEAIIENRLEEAKKAEEKKTAKKTLNEMENRIGLRGAINNILREHFNNEKLRMFCEKYINAINEGKAEEVLYESFISGISPWNYLSAVDTEMSALGDRVKKYKQEIDIKKILETMLNTGSYYIVPLIEDVVIDFAEHKNMTTRALMLQRLESFEYDPFVRDIMNIAYKDQSLGDNVYLGESVENINNLVESEKIYSPIFFIKENESVFNVKGTYYKRSGNSVSKLGRNEVMNLSESYRNFCDLLNSSSVKINPELNTINVYGDGRNVALIKEGEIYINDVQTSSKDLDKLASTARLMREENMMQFCAAIKVLNEKFNDIAYIDFVKRVSSKENRGIMVDVFKINESIFLNTINESLGKSTFYKNINPIQCRNYINEHMGVNVAPLFEDVLPDQEMLKKNIDDKKKEYEEYIKDLEDKKDTLEKMKSEASDTKDIDDAIDLINKEIEDTKADYKKYQKDADEFINGKKDDDDEPEDDDKPEGGDDNKGEDSEDRTEEPAETPAEMEEPITDNPENMTEPDGNIEDTEEISEPEEDEYTDVPEFDADFDVAIGYDDLDDRGKSVVEDTDGYKVVRVSYNKNVKTGKVSNKGEVIVVIPSVDANGDVHDDMRKITFMLDADHKPIVNNEYMPLAMYNAIVDAINNAPETDNVNVVGGDDEPEPDPTTPSPIPEDPDSPVDDNSTVEDVTAIVNAVDNNENLPEPKETEDKVEVEGEEKIEPAKQESPAEVKADSEEAIYPITFSVGDDDVAPRDFDAFVKDLGDMKIDNSKSEGVDNRVCCTVKNMAQVDALSKYFKKWFDYGESEFKSFFPELKKCFNNNPTNIPVQPANESVQIKNVKVVNESKSERFNILVPATDTYKNMFGVDCKEGVTAFRMVAESENEAQKIYNRLYEHSLKNDVEQDVKDILENYAPKYKENADKSVKYTLTVPYNGFLESKLESKGFGVSRLNENMSAEILSSDYAKAKKVLESFYGDAAPVEAKDFFQFVCENVRITVKDENTGKTVEINTDDFNGKNNQSGESADFDSSFKDTITFDTADSMELKDDVESSDEGEGKKEKKEDGVEEKKTEDASEETAEPEKKEEIEVTDTEEEDNKEGKPKKKFKFKAKKKEYNESVKESSAEHLNESANATVLDYVIIPGGKKGQVICELADGTVIVNVEGHTVPFQKKQLKLTKEKLDTVQYPMEPDMKKLKGLVESYVSCGMFLNNNRVTPEDCKVKLVEFVNAQDNDEINIIIEGESTKATKKYIRITENLNDVLDLGNYAKGKMTMNIENAITESDVLINIKDYNLYKNINEETCPVRTLVFDEDGNTHLRYVNGTQLHLDESNDIYVPQYVRDLGKALTFYN